MTAALKRAIRNFGLTAAVASMALLAAPRAASAQYTLTFGTTHDGLSVGSPYTGNGSVEAPASVVSITTGWSSEFGQTSISSNTANAACAPGLCYTASQVPVGEAAHFLASGAGVTSGVGEFIIDPTGSRVAGLTSFLLGNSANADQAAMVRIYSLDGLTLLATYTDANVGKKASSTVLLSDFSVQGGGSLASLQSNMLNGFRFEWGTNANADDHGDRLFIDNMIFKSELAPEPNTMLLLGTGLLGLAPLARRRRKNKKA